MANDITILSCPQCGFPKIRDCGNGLYQCDDCGTHFDKSENIVLTNEEWLHTLNTEQLADVIADFYLLGYTHGHNQMDITSKTKWFEWLKQPHIKE